MSDVNLTHVTWFWSDEARILAQLKPAKRERYIAANLRRAVDFDGKPVTLEWEARFLEVVDSVLGDRVSA